MKLFELIRKSVYSPEFYHVLPSRPLSFSIKYFYSLTIALSLGFTLVSSFRLVPAVHSFFQGLGPAVLGGFPDELVVTIKGGTASTNVSEPYILSIPEILLPAEFNTPDPHPKNLLVVDTSEPFSGDRFERHNTIVLLTKDSVIYREDKGRLTIQSLSGVPDATVTKATVSFFMGKITALSGWVIPIVIFGIFIGFLTAISFKLVYLLLGALLVWGILKIRKVAGSYRDAYQIGIHAMTLGLILGFLLALITPGSRLPFLFTLFMLVVAWVNLAPEKQAAPPSQIS